MPFATDAGRLLPAGVTDRTQEDAAMTLPPPSAGRILPLDRTGLPAWCDRHLPSPLRDTLGGRAWYDTTLAHAVPAGASPLLAVSGNGAVLLPLMRQDGRLRSLTTPYSLNWRPLLRDDADPDVLLAAGQDFGQLLRREPPVMLEALAPGELLDTFLDGVRSAGIVPLFHDHFGNWHETLRTDDGWEGYFEERPSALQATIRRKTARCLREAHFDWIEQPGPKLEAGIAAYETVRRLSWKPHEPSPGFDSALMRALAAAGTLRLGVLRRRNGAGPLAAQYWAVSGGRAVVLKLAHDEAHKAVSPGTVLTALMLTRILDDGEEVRELDFGRGDDPYKRLWAGRRRQRMGVTLADPRQPSGLLAIARHAAGRALRAARSRLEHHNSTESKA
jgi:hypothetical protein